MLGLNLHNGVLTVDPNLPTSWDGYEADWIQNGKTYHIIVKKDGHVTVTLNGTPVSNKDVVVVNRNKSNLIEN